MLVQVYEREAVSRNVFTNDSNAFAMGRKRLRMSHVRVGHRQTEPQKWSRKCDKCWHKIGDWMRRNWALARTRSTPSSEMTWVSGRSAPDSCHTGSQTSRKQNGWKHLETSFPCVTRIHCFWKTSGATSSIRKQNGNRWRGVHQLPRDQKSHLQISKVKTLFMAFFDNKGIIHKEFVPAGQTINAAFYQAVLNRFLQRIRWVRPELHRTGKMDAALR